MPEKNFLKVMFENRDKQEMKGQILQEDVKSFQEIERLKEEIVTNVKTMIKENFPPITSRLDQIYELLVKIGLKVDITDLEKEVLQLLKDEVKKKK